MTERLTPRQVREALKPLFGPCILCEHRCGAMRLDGERGACGLGEAPLVYNRMLHLGEERELVPSYAIFLAGCSMLCSFCSEHAHLRPTSDEGATSPERLAEKVAAHLAKLKGRVRAIRNINFVGGEPSIALPHLAAFTEALDALIDDRPPLLLNTNGYMTPPTLALATHLCEIFVVDLKFGGDACGEQVGDVPRYSQVLRRNLTWLHQANVSGPHQPEEADHPILPTDLWVRHLLMPGHLECCTRPALTWLAEHLPSARVNLMPQFHPFRGATNARWGHLEEEERASGLALLREAGLENAWFDGRRVEP